MRNVRCLLICLFFLEFGFAKNLYVAPNGSDSVPYSSNNINNPWASVDHAWLNVKTGDTLFFREGTYNKSGTLDNRNAENGTSSNPIVISSYPGETAIIDGNGAGEMFNHEKSYYIIENLHFRNGARCFHVGEDKGANYNIFRNNLWTTNIGGDNVGFVTDQTAVGNQILNNVLIGPGGGAHGNTAGIVVFRSTGVKILNNEIHNFPIGIYYKHANDNGGSDIEIAYNYIYDTSRFSIFTNSNNARIHDNILQGAVFRVNESNGNSGGDGNNIYHNTVFPKLLLSKDDGGADNNIITNNIFLGGIDIQSGSDGNSFDYNLYSGTSAGGSHSITGSPTFVGGSTPSTIEGFVLSTGSKGENAASDGKDMGADVSQVGPTNTIKVGDTTPPGAVKNVKISK